MLKYMSRPKLLISALPAFCITALYFGFPLFSDWLTSKPEFAKYADRDAPRIVEAVQQALVYPIGKWLPALWRGLLVFPYWLLIFSGIAWLYQKAQPVSKYVLRAALGILVFLFIFPNTLLWLESRRPSVSHGSVRDGWIEGSKRLPFRGDNFTTYSFAGYLFGRTHVHEKVRKTVVEAFARCTEKKPDTRYVIGETGRPRGGAFHPHRTHRNGLSIDIMTPFLRRDRPYRSHHLFNLWGYALEVDEAGRLDENTVIDYDSLAEIILAIKEIAPKNGLRIEKVIFDPVLRPYLFSTEAGKNIRNLPYTKNRVILRHDDHFHVDFAVDQ